MSTVTASEARATLPELLDRVSQGEEITITRHGRPVPVVLRPDSVRARRADAAYKLAAEIGAELERARHEPVRPAAGFTAEDAEELIAEIRAGRARR